MKKTAAALSAVLLGTMLVSGCTPSAHKSVDTAKKITGPVALTAHVHVEMATGQGTNGPVDRDRFYGGFEVSDRDGYLLFEKKIVGHITPSGSHDWYFHLGADKVGRLHSAILDLQTDYSATLRCVITWNPGDNSAEGTGSMTGLAPSNSGCVVQNPE